MKSDSGSQHVSVFHIQKSDRLDMKPVAALTRLMELTHFQVDKDPECRSCGSRHGASAGCLKPKLWAKLQDDVAMLSQLMAVTRKQCAAAAAKLPKDQNNPQLKNTLDGILKKLDEHAANVAKQDRGRPSQTGKPIGRMESAIGRMAAPVIGTYTAFLGCETEVARAEAGADLSMLKT